MESIIYAMTALFSAIVGIVVGVIGVRHERKDVDKTLKEIADIIKVHQQDLDEIKQEITTMKINMHELQKINKEIIIDNNELDKKINYYVDSL